MPTLRHIAFVFVVAGTALAQTTHVVQGGGAALQTAIAAAAPGDRLVVQPGNYDPVTCSIGVDIDLTSGATVEAAAGLVGLRIANLPAGQTARVLGGRVEGISILQSAGTIVVHETSFDTQVVPWQFSQCTGPVMFQGATGLSPTTVAVGSLDIDGCAQVSFTGCVLPQLRVSQSRVNLSQSWVHPMQGNGVAGLHVLSGDVTVVGGTLNGTFQLSFPIPTVAVRVDGGTFTATGGTLIDRASFPYQPAHSLEVNAGAVRLDPSVIVGGTPPIAGAGSVTFTPVASLVANHTATTLSAVVTSEPGSAVFTLAGFPSPPYATQWGDAWLQASDPVLHFAVMPATGTSSFSRSFAGVPRWLELTLQPVALRSNGAVVLGAPTRLLWD
ncbi:MAG: hypothetical protein H6838_00420 [Planctomycetes bacterium]|nr:hypothetical protein [Planctomycetota bacterium]MCB9883918.1 hypothetical protein [Planctomycetota bacterium]